MVPLEYINIIVYVNGSLTNIGFQALRGHGLLPQSTMCGVRLIGRLPIPLLVIFFPNLLLKRAIIRKNRVHVTPCEDLAII